jgi:hypothetical protein
LGLHHEGPKCDCDQECDCPLQGLFPTLRCESHRPFGKVLVYVSELPLKSKGRTSSELIQPKSWSTMVGSSLLLGGSAGFGCLSAAARLRRACSLELLPAFGPSESLTGANSEVRLSPDNQTLRSSQFYRQFYPRSQQGSANSQKPAKHCDRVDRILASLVTRVALIPTKQEHGVEIRVKP